MTKAETIRDDKRSGLGGSLALPKAADADVRGPWRAGRGNAFLHGVMDVISSLRLTVVFLCLALLLVFIGTLAQVEEGLYNAQHRYFRSFFIWWGPEGANWKLPVFPGGYLIGGVLLINLLAAHARRFKLSKKKIGILVVHAGLVLMILGQLATDLMSVESGMHLYEGETKSYSEDFRNTELAVIESSALPPHPDPLPQGGEGSPRERERVYSVPGSLLAKGGEIKDARLPFTVRVKQYWVNADLLSSRTNGAVEAGATAGVFKDVFVLPLGEVLDTERRNVPAAVVELVGKDGSAGSFLVYAGVTTRQNLTLDGKPYEVSLRFARYYYPFSITLLQATHERYKGTDVPKNFASRVRVDNPARNEARETVVYMNNPLRYAGLTFFQYQMIPYELLMQAEKPWSTLQVVRNPGWVTPYVSCVLVTLGLMIQFMSHLIGFVAKRK